MSERHTHQNRFAGTTGVAHRSTRGGVAHVGPNDTLGWLGGCWCGGELCEPDPENPGNSIWPGSKDGAPHPRFRNETKETEVTRVADDAPPYVDPKDLRRWPSEVAEVVIYLVNEQGIKYRFADGNTHLILYPPDGVSRPFKTNANRPWKQSIQFLRSQFMGRYGIPGPDGVVPGAPEPDSEPAESDDSASGAPESTDPATGAEIASLVPGAAEAVRALAATLGIDMAGGVSEEDYLAVVAEKDQCRARSEELVVEMSEMQTEIETWVQTCADLTAQRDQLLATINNVFEMLETARA